MLSVYFCQYRKKDVKRVDKWMKFIQSNGFDSFYKGRPNEEVSQTLPLTRLLFPPNNGFRNAIQQQNR